MVKRVQELNVYQLAFSTAMEIFRLSRKWPREEQRSLTSQIIRSSRSISANLSEAWGKRRYPEHFVSKLTDCDSECLETLTWLEFAKECGYLAKTDFDLLSDKLDHVSAMLVKMMSEPAKWCGPSILRNKSKLT